MTVGKKIKFLRKRLKITQEDLAERTGIHVVSIRRYENDKMLPKEAQVEKIAKILNVRPYVLSNNNYDFQLETYGDVYGLLIYLYKIGGIEINRADDVSVQIHDKMFDRISVSGNCTIQITGELKNLPSFDKFIFWLDAIKELEGFINSLSNKENPVTEKTIKTIKEQVEVFELQLMQSTQPIK